jgi:hypothetical protein
MLETKKLPHKCEGLLTISRIGAVLHMFRGTAIRLVRRRPQAFAFVEIMGPEQVTVPDAMITLHNWAHDVNGDGVGGVGSWLLLKSAELIGRGGAP